jgi:hypothetical protein
MTRRSSNSRSCKIGSVAFHGGAVIEKGGHDEALPRNAPRPYDHTWIIFGIEI